ncbi:phosphopentomutase [Maledivibacter halophilus]|uniref:Phosphopentomutase n=1 Tax=Maledivibacter halophilus TaxID=36842 RepID=A0A1T5M0Y3_9FIRM|nr:phosphopentomutase [Maledivibacter halophilus]SKC81765.1 Phosphopentomutase [Maledivibacter halophilus]
MTAWERSLDKGRGNMKKRAIVLIIDSLGIGYMDDVKRVRPQDEGANTFYHILDKSKDIKIPNLERLGINRVLRHPRLKKDIGIASYGILNLQHYGADSYAGHQEIMGTKPKKPLMKPFVYFMDNVKAALEKQGYKVEIPNTYRPYLLVNELVVVADNIETDYGQIYNITAPLDHISFDEVLKIGKIVRKNVKVNRVIALGGKDVSIKEIIDSIERREDGLIGVNSPKSGVYKKGYQARHLGFGVNPEKQISSILSKLGKEITLIGKMQDVIKCDKAKNIPAVDTQLVMKEIIKQLHQMNEGLISATVQETDLAGHAQDVELYAKRIMLVDKYLGIIIENMTKDDLLIISADHGNDPTIGHSQHTREKTFLLAYSKRLSSNYIGERKTLSDIAATIGEYFNSLSPENGQSFYSSLNKKSDIR